MPAGAVVLLVLALSTPAGRLQAQAQDRNVLFREEFDSLEGWNELAFRKIDRHSQYRAVSRGGASVLEIVSEASASGIVFDRTFDVFRYPILEWRWQVEDVLAGGDATRKQGDDYPIRVYVIFRYDPDKVGGFDRLRYETAKAFYGEYPPLASLNYIWANQPRSREPLPNPFTERAMMIPVDGGREHVGRWRVHQVNMLEDYRLAFGEDPPREASLAVMGDSDNTGGRTRAYLDYLEVRRQP